MLIYVTSLLVLKYTGVAKPSLIKMTGSSVLLFLLGILLFHETATVFRWIGMFFMVLTILFSSKKTGQEEVEHKGKIKRIVCLAFSVVISVASSLLIKYYTAEPDVCNNNSFFFLTNMLLFVFGGIGLIVAFIKNPKETKTLLQSYKAADYVVVFGKTILDNLTSLVTMVLISSVNLTFYTVLSSALSVVSAIAASLALKEKLTFKLVLATIFAIVAIIFNVL